MVLNKAKRLYQSVTGRDQDESDDEFDEKKSEMLGQNQRVE